MSQQDSLDKQSKNYAFSLSSYSAVTFWLNRNVTGPVEPDCLFFAPKTC